MLAAVDARERTPQMKKAGLDESPAFFVQRFGGTAA
jgi:hypothetical protein